MSKHPFHVSLFVSVALLALPARPASSQELAAEPTQEVSAEENTTFSMNWSSEPNVAFTLPAVDEPARRIELQVAATGGPLDVSLSRTAIVPDESWRGDGAELRIGRFVGRRSEHDSNESTYFYVASENEALTWRPGQDRGGGSALALQEQVEVGDLSAGVAIERGGVQASLSYVEREASARVGNQSFSQDENFAGVTVTMRH